MLICDDIIMLCTFSQSMSGTCHRHVKMFKHNLSSKVIDYNLSFRFGKVVI